MTAGKPKRQQPETAGEAKAWERVKNHALRYGLCHRCASQLAWGHQIGFASLEHEPCPECAGIIATLPRERPNGWRTVNGTAHDRRSWEAVSNRPADQTLTGTPADAAVRIKSAPGQVTGPSQQATAGAQQTKDRHKIARVPCLHTTTTATGQCETCGAWLTITLPPDDRFPTTVTPGDGTP